MEHPLDANLSGGNEKPQFFGNNLPYLRDLRSLRWHLQRLWQSLHEWADTLSHLDHDARRLHGSNSIIRRTVRKPHSLTIRTILLSIIRRRYDTNALECRQASRELFRFPALNNKNENIRIHFDRRFPTIVRGDFEFWHGMRDLLE